ncbi:elongation factor P hydroxylase [Psychrobacter sp.]|uniref:elongation factor P hydroxylase n=1 Tax=Psychrobacter sp. TaxID=56811 RepID=UPI003F94A969
MNSLINKIDFATLLPQKQAETLLSQLTELNTSSQDILVDPLVLKQSENVRHWKSEWHSLTQLKDCDNTQESINNYEKLTTDWLIQLFNTLFSDQQIVLSRSDGEPEYFPIQNGMPARIEFAHGFFASALHEISHWCIAGEARRRLPDFGYWYAPDGRTEKQQQAFERVEIKPQALECLFTLACNRSFEVSQDNLFADFDTSSSTFAEDVYLQAKEYILKPHTIPRDAKVILHALLTVCASH